MVYTPLIEYSTGGLIPIICTREIDGECITKRFFVASGQISKYLNKMYRDFNTGKK